MYYFYELGNNVTLSPEEAHELHAYLFGDTGQPGFDDLMVISREDPPHKTYLRVKNPRVYPAFLMIRRPCRLVFQTACKVL